MRSSTHPRVRQFLDRIAEPAVSEEIGLFANADGRTPPSGSFKSGEERLCHGSKREQAIVGLFVLVAAAVLVATVFALTGAFAGAAVTYRAYFPFAGGLEPGATVRYARRPKSRPWSKNCSWTRRILRASR